MSLVSVLAVRPEAGAKSCGLLVLTLPATQATSAMPPTFPACVTESMLAPMTQMWSQADWQCYRRVVEDSLELYTCRPGSSDSEIPASASNDTALGSYNELATLMTVTGGPSLPPNLVQAAARWQPSVGEQCVPLLILCMTRSPPVHGMQLVLMLFSYAWTQDSALRTGGVDTCHKDAGTWGALRVEPTPWHCSRRHTLSSHARFALEVSCGRRGGRHPAPAVSRHAPRVRLRSHGGDAGHLLCGGCLGSRQRDRLGPVCAHAAHRVLRGPPGWPAVRGHCGCWGPWLPGVSLPWAPDPCHAWLLLRVLLPGVCHPNQSALSLPPRSLCAVCCPMCGVCSCRGLWLSWMSLPCKVQPIFPRCACSAQCTGAVGGGCRAVCRASSLLPKQSTSSCLADGGTRVCEQERMSTHKASHTAGC